MAEKLRKSNFLSWKFAHGGNPQDRNFRYFLLFTSYERKRL
ncbi:MAG: hypothetical protein AAF316_10790 [Cyanobacteria bacterium P01_A01_bin.80]